MNSFEREWRQETTAKVRAFFEELGDEGRSIRLEALNEQLREAEEDLKDRLEKYEMARKEDQPYINRALIASFIPDVEARIEKLKRHIRGIMAEAEGHTPKDKITPAMIDRAREYPIEDLIGNSGRRGNVLCVTHLEKNPSMSLKGNRARCFSCGYFGDSIDVFMKLNGCGFIEAVRALQ